jgi:hypothetical protein
VSAKADQAARSPLQGVRRSRSTEGEFVEAIIGRGRGAFSPAALAYLPRRDAAEAMPVARGILPVYGTAEQRLSRAHTRLSRGRSEISISTQKAST